MSVVVVGGSSGLIASEAAAFLCKKGFDVVGLDNDMRACFFGREASTAWSREWPKHAHGIFMPHDVDTLDAAAVDALLARHGNAIHAAAQPSHNWTARKPLTGWRQKVSLEATVAEIVDAVSQRRLNAG